MERKRACGAQKRPGLVNTGNEKRNTKRPTLRGGEKQRKERGMARTMTDLPSSLPPSPNRSARSQIDCARLSTPMRSLYVKWWFCARETKLVKHGKCGKCCAYGRLDTGVIDHRPRIGNKAARRAANVIVNLENLFNAARLQKL